MERQNIQTNKQTIERQNKRMMEREQTNDGKTETNDGK